MTFSSAGSPHRRFSLLAALLMVASCDGSNPPNGPTPLPGEGIRDSAALFQLITKTEPFTGYTLFPNAEEFTEGRLNGSEAHRPIVRVSVNAKALDALKNGRLPDGAQFPDGSIIFKEIRPRTDASTTVYAVMYKDAGNPLAGDGWLWAEFNPDGSPIYSVESKGGACTSCHRREQGPQNDLVRTFERQGTTAAPPPDKDIRDSAALFELITKTDPFTGYTLFPNAEEFTEGRLNGSEAHRPIVRVSVNAKALGALQNGRLPNGARFPDGSVIFKEIRQRPDAPTAVYAVMYKDAGNPAAGEGWLWAEFNPDGRVVYPTSGEGGACIFCHSREQGTRNDLVRTFERQR